MAIAVYFHSGAYTASITASYPPPDFDPASTQLSANCAEYWTAYSQFEFNDS